MMPINPDKSYSLPEFIAIKKRLLNEGFLKIQIISGSMSPLIKSGDYVHLEPSDSYEKFDVVIYHADDNRLICHFYWRPSVFKKNAHLLQAFGYASFDQTVDTDKLLGKVVGHQITSFLKLIFFIKWIFRIRPS